MKIYKQMTACEAVKHFEANGWKSLWPGNRNGRNKEYSWGQKIIQDAHGGNMSDTRARALLEKFGGEAYRVTSAFEVEINESNGPAFAEGVKALQIVECIYCGSECERKDGLNDEYNGKQYRYSAYVCKADPSHKFQTGEQMDKTLELLKR